MNLTHGRRIVLLMLPMLSVSATPVEAQEWCRLDQTATRRWA
jgi:hypothetical protein